MVQIIDENWRTKNTKIPHKTIKRITMMNPNKKNNNIITNINSQDQIITDIDLINKIRLEKLK